MERAFEQVGINEVNETREMDDFDIPGNLNDQDLDIFLGIDPHGLQTLRTVTEEQKQMFLDVLDSEMDERIQRLKDKAEQYANEIKERCRQEINSIPKEIREMPLDELIQNYDYNPCNPEEYFKDEFKHEETHDVIQNYDCNPCNPDEYFKDEFKHEETHDVIQNYDCNPCNPDEYFKDEFKHEETHDVDAQETPVVKSNNKGNRHKKTEDDRSELNEQVESEVLPRQRNNRYNMRPIRPVVAKEGLGKSKNRKK